MSEQARERERELIAHTIEVMVVSRTEEEDTHSMADAAEGKMLLLTVSPGKLLGLTIRIDKILGGCTINKIDLVCTFKDQVEIGDRIVTIDGQKITTLADFQINNAKTRKFGVIKKILKDNSEKSIMTNPKQHAPPPSSQAANNTAATPVPNKAAPNNTGNPVVTTEKSTCATKNANNKVGEEGGNIQVLITCPDGSVINLSQDQMNHAVLGRGEYGIPSSSSAVLPHACALRIVETYDAPKPRKQFALELVALGTERCTVLRDGNALFLMSITQILTSGKDSTCPSSIIIRNGDIIEPCDREKATVNNSVHYEFKVEIVAGGASSPTATGKTEDAVAVDGSAFAAASRKIDEAATMGVGKKPLTTNPYAKSNPHDVKGCGEAVVNHYPFDFDKESLRKAFLQNPNSTANFFRVYLKTLSKKKSTNADTDSGDNVLNAFIDAMSPQDIASRDVDVKFSSKLDEFPLKQILEIMVDGKHMELGKRAIEGYIWLSCQNNAKKPFDPPSGPILLASSDLRLASMCETIGWEKLEGALVNAMEMLCKYQKTSVRAFALVEKVEPSGLSHLAKSRVFFRMVKLAYEKWFTADPAATALHFIRYHRSVFLRSYDASVKLSNAFVDAMSPSDKASRRGPKKEVDGNFPLKDILTILVDAKHAELGKRVLEGYVWLSSQKVSNDYSSSISEPKGPMLLVRYDFPLVSMCNKIGWGLLGDVLVDSIEMLCELKNTAKAFELMQKVTSTSSDCEGDSQYSHVCVRLANVASKKMLTTERFHADPTATAKLLVTQYKNLGKEPSNTELCGDLLNSFVDIMSPRDSNSRKVPLKQVSADFPLKDLLTILVDDGKHMDLGKRVLESYVWLSSQRVSGYYSNLGPQLLDTVEAPLVSLCDAFGWNEFENVLVQSVEALCRSSFKEKAVLLVDKIAPPASERRGHRFRICSEMAKIACNKMIIELSVSCQDKSGHRLPLYKKLLFLVGNYCPTLAPKFVTVAKNLDVDAMLHPLLTDVALRSSSSADAMKNILSQLTMHCVELLNSRVSSDPDIVTAWQITNAHLYRATNFGEFLLNQCKQTFDWKVRKSDHRGFQKQLRSLIATREITSESHQRGYSGPYYFKITKLKTCRVVLSALSCSCSSSFGSTLGMLPSGCLRHSSQVKRRNDKVKFDAIKAYLTADQLSSHKRKASDALGDDDDIVLTGVAGVAETVAKRVKAAEDAGEVIEIL